MTKEMFDKLQKSHGDEVVWLNESDGTYNFAMSDDLMNMTVEDWKLYEKLEEKACVNGMLVEGQVGWSLGYGDDVINCVSVKKLEDLQGEMLKFVLEYVGDNCYTTEDDEDDEDWDD